MNMSKKKVFTIALAVCLIAILSFTTLAWFNDSDSVTNDFHVSDSNGDGKPDFTVEVVEQLVNPDGTPVVDENGDPVLSEEQGNTYEDILPGDNLLKVAYVKNTGDYEQWIRVNITLSDSAVWQNAIAKVLGDQFNADSLKAYLMNNLLGGFNSELYNLAEPVLSFNILGEDTMTLTVYYNWVLEPDSYFQVMESFNIPGALEQEDMNFGTDGFTVTIFSEAVQVENVTYESASKAFDLVGWEIGTNYGE